MFNYLDTLSLVNICLLLIKKKSSWYFMIFIGIKD